MNVHEKSVVLNSWKTSKTRFNDLRSRLSKIVGNLEVGQIFAIIGIGQAIVALISHR